MFKNSCASGSSYCVSEKAGNREKTIAGHKANIEMVFKYVEYPACQRENPVKMWANTLDL